LETEIAEMTLVPTADLVFTPTTVPTEPSPLPTVEPTPFPTPVPTVAPTVQPTAAPQPTSPPAPSDGNTYTVQPGDTLYSIAKRYGTTVETLAALNNIVNPSRIRAGLVLQISGTAPPPQPPQGDIVYVVQPGENLFRIALRHNMSYLYLAAYNNIANPNDIYVGQTILIP
jgi:LysM repeat protein